LQVNSVKVKITKKSYAVLFVSKNFAQVNENRCFSFV
jgi:hypothetical protein